MACSRIAFGTGYPRASFCIPSPPQYAPIKFDSGNVSWSSVTFNGPSSKNARTGMVCSALPGAPVASPGFVVHAAKVAIMEGQIHDEARNKGVCA